MEREKRRPGWVRTVLALVLLVIGVGTWTYVVTAMGDPPILGEVGTLVIFAAVFVGFFRSKNLPQPEPTHHGRAPTTRRLCKKI